MEKKLSDMKISGTGTISSGEYNEVKISGSAKIEVDIDCSYYKCSGSSTANGNVKSKIIGISGSTKICGNVDTEEMIVSGSSRIMGNVNTKKLKISGSSIIEGSLHTENMKIKSGTGHFFIRMINLFSNYAKLVTGVIEGDDIYLENTVAKIVRGNNVTIGPNCDIEIVEYRDKVDVGENSKIICKKIS
ncbi:polymer-forming cytoskeletal protein [Clostridium kluyveri]|uniref:polymer-forming cytoskeletal protein n=1 Tax=Clostridium kluyveri TaxID=1534 RepID=UPI002245E404|nr:polymer-forming cytoskeletal protein [Clostridium kluyveri]UZQ49728.1 polymer-forming cytoskeletal protein [Clostridium kluyveri]